MWNPIQRFKAAAGKIADKMMAWGLESNVLEAYEYLMEYWSPGDQVFLFGFSRGAYSVRVLSGLLHTMGLLPQGSHNLSPYAIQLYKSLRGATSPTSNPWRTCNQFRRTFSRETTHRSKRFPIRFLGVWDTVSTVGWLWNPTNYPNTRANGSIQTIRQAVSIDERRVFFRQNLFLPKPGQDVKELWFAGDHSDIGGGHDAASGSAWKIPFEWMVKEAAGAGLLIDRESMDLLLNRSPALSAAWSQPLHSLLRRWWTAEFVPKRQWDWKSSSFKWRCGHFGRRYIPNGSRLHKTVLMRLRDEKLAYDPKNLSEEFRKHVRELRIELPDEIVTF